VFKLPFRLVPGGALTSEQFDTYEDAVRFGKLVDRVGGQAARDIRTASTTSALDMPTLRTHFDVHLATVAASRTPGTVAEYRRVAERTWLPALGDLPVDAVTRDAVVKWVASQRAVETQRSAAARAKAITAQRRDPTVVVPAPRTYSPKSIRNAHALLSDALGAALDRGLVSRNVARGVQMPSDHEHAEMVILTEREFLHVLDELAPHYRPLVLTLYSTGLRWGEATALTPGDLDLDARVPTLHVVRSWKKGASGVYLGSPKTRRAVRTIALGAQLVPLLRELADGRPGDALLFTTPSGTRIRQNHFWERVWTPALDGAEIGKRPRVHDLRHTHASMMINAGMNLLQLQYRLGHESLKTTGDTYGHLLPDALAAGAMYATGVLAAAMPQIES
jgi:integrase